MQSSFDWLLQDGDGRNKDSRNKIRKCCCRFLDGDCRGCQVLGCERTRLRARKKWFSVFESIVAVEMESRVVLGGREDKKARGEQKQKRMDKKGLSSRWEVGCGEDAG